MSFKMRSNIIVFHIWHRAKLSGRRRFMKINERERKKIRIVK